MSNEHRNSGREAFWRSVIKQWGDSGLSVRAFCRQKNLSEGNFYSWRRKIAQRDREASCAEQEGNPEPSQTRRRRAGQVRQDPNFVPVLVTGTRARETGFIIELAGGHRLRLPEAITSQELASVVHALEAESSQRMTPEVGEVRTEGSR